jgi:hypothetical protein
MWALLLACADAPAAPEIAAGTESSASAAPLAASVGPTEDPLATTLGEAFPPPAGAVRVDGGPFGAWLLDRKVLPIDVPVTTYEGEVVPHDARVIDMDLVPGDLQQCADSAIRLRAEWERSTGKSPMFHATSGDEMPWSRFSAGETPYAVGNGLAWKRGSTGKWEDWLRLVFTWAGTRSLAFDTVPVDDPLPGDLVVHPGSPGHAVVLLDVARDHDATYVLIGEGFMPAQSFHVERGPYANWWKFEDGAVSPPWGLLSGGTLRRWKPS